MQASQAGQAELDLEGDDEKDRSRLMSAMDAINNRYGKGTVHVASTGLCDTSQTWGMRQERRTPQYTTRVSDIPTVRT